MLKVLLALKPWAWALIIIAVVLACIGASLGIFFFGRWFGKTEFKRFIRRRPKPIDDEEYYGIDKELDRRIELITKWLSVMRGKNSRVDVSGACMELMKLYDLRQYLAIMNIRDRAAARLYAKDFLDKRKNELFDLYEEIFGEKDESAQTVATKKTPTPRKKKYPDEAVERANVTPAPTVAPAPNVTPAPKDGTAATVDDKKDGTAASAPIKPLEPVEPTKADEKK